MKTKKQERLENKKRKLKAYLEMTDVANRAASRKRKHDDGKDSPDSETSTDEVSPPRVKRQKGIANGDVSKLDQAISKGQASNQAELMRLLEELRHEKQRLLDEKLRFLDEKEQYMKQLLKDNEVSAKQAQGGAVKGRKQQKAPQRKTSKGITNDQISSRKSDDDYDYLRKEYKERKKKPNKPVLFLTEVGVRAQMAIESNSDGTLKSISGSVAPLLPKDILHLVLRAILRERSPFSIFWCKLLHPCSVSQVVIVFVRGLSSEKFQNIAHDMKSIRSNFDKIVEVMPPADNHFSFMDKLFALFPLLLSKPQEKGNKMAETKDGGKGSPSDGQKAVVNSKFRKLLAKWGVQNKLDDVREVHFPETNDKLPPSTSPSKILQTQKPFSRLSLLLTPEQMKSEGYALVPEIYNFPRDYRLSKAHYKPVTEYSPMFGLDCEMCLTTAKKSELTRVSIVNENCECIYDKLVLPDNKIINYLTQYSGITEEMLKGVTTRLADVQKDISALLPPDAILVGQSLNGDLHALKLIHPYVIDTSVVYNITGVRRTKSKLKLLSALFLKEVIQAGKDGHNPIEDSASAMKLALLKLEKGLEFGDVILSSLLPENELEEGEDKVKDVNVKGSKDRNQVLVIDCEEAKDFKGARSVTWREDERVDYIKVSTNKEVAIQACQELSKYKLAVAGIDMPMKGESETDDGSNVSKLDKRLKRIYKSCLPNALVMVVFDEESALNTKDDVGNLDKKCKYKNSLCAVTLKPQDSS